MIIVTGSKINVIDGTIYVWLARKKIIFLQRSRSKLFTYGSKQELPMMKKFEFGKSNNPKFLANFSRSNREFYLKICTIQKTIPLRH